MGAVLREGSKTIQRTIVEAMTVGVAGEKGKPVRKPFGQGCLEAVVIRIRAVGRLVDKLQVGELCGVRTDAIGCCRSDARWGNLIEVAEKQQPFAFIADVAELERKVIGEGVLDAQVPTGNVRGFEIRVDRQEVTRRSSLASGATDPAAGRKNNTIPVGRCKRISGVGEHVSAAKGLWTRRHLRCAGASRVGSDTSSSAILQSELRGKRAHRDCRVDDTGSASDHSHSLATYIPGKAHPWREVFAVGVHDRTTNRWLALLNDPSRGVRIEVTKKVVDLVERRYVGVAQSQIEH